MFSTGYGMPPGVKWTIIGTVIVFFLQNMNPFINHFVKLFPFYLPHFTPFQLISHMFAHADLGHIFFNMITLWVFGSQFEREFGTKEFFSIYLLSGITTGLIYTFLTDITVLGASAAVYGMMVAFAYFWPNAQLLVFGIFPVRAKILILILMGIGLLYTASPSPGDNTAHLGHLIGAVTAFIYLQIKYRRYSIKDLLS